MTPACAPRPARWRWAGGVVPPWCTDASARGWRQARKGPAPAKCGRHRQSGGSGLSSRRQPTRSPGPGRCHSQTVGSSRSIRPDTAIRSVRVATVRSTPRSSVRRSRSRPRKPRLAGRQRCRNIADCSASAKPSDQPAANLQQIGSRRGHGPLAGGSPCTNPARALCTALWAVVGPRRPLWRRRAVQIAHLVPARAVQPRAQPGGRACIKPSRHTLEAELFHLSILAGPQSNASQAHVSPQAGAMAAGHARRRAHRGALSRPTWCASAHLGWLLLGIVLHGTDNLVMAGQHARR